MRALAIWMAIITAAFTAGWLVVGCPTAADLLEAIVD